MSELRERLEQWAREVCLEAIVQGFEAGQEHAHRETVKRGEGARLLRGRQIRENEAPFVPIAGSEMDGFPPAILALLDSSEPAAWCAYIHDDFDSAEDGILLEGMTGGRLYAYDSEEAAKKVSGQALPLFTSPTPTPDPEGGEE